MFIILCVIDNTEKLDAVLDSWQEAGLPGATIVESSGLHRHRGGERVPMRYLFGGATASERGNYTLITVVESEAQIQRCLEATERVIGSFDQPNSGIFTAWPLMVARGVSGKRPSKGVEHDLD